MATVIKVNGIDVETPMAQIGRNLEWVLDTAAINAATVTAGSLALETHCSVTIIGAPAVAGCVFGCEGVSSTALTATQSIVTLSGATFA